jgi:glutathione S-transferase
MNKLIISLLLVALFGLSAGFRLQNVGGANHRMHLRKPKMMQSNNQADSQNDYKIVVGSKKYSSWSLRGWLGVRLVAGKNNFEEEFCQAPGVVSDPTMKEIYRKKIFELSPSGKVPALIDNKLGITVVESLAILIHLGLKHPESGLLPADAVARALCISAASEMHAGFMALRNHCSMHTLAICSKKGDIAFARSDVQEDVKRLQNLWEGLLTRFGTGKKDSFLFGTRPTIADCMYAPVAIRFKGFDPNKKYLSPKSQDYVDTLLNMDGVKEWIADSKNLSTEFDVPAYETPAD